jgi:hypothetical protein
MELCCTDYEYHYACTIVDVETFNASNTEPRLENPWIVRQAA